MEQEKINSITIGSICISSSTADLEHITELAKAILQDKTFREYLDLVKTASMIGGNYFG